MKQEERKTSEPNGQFRSEAPPGAQDPGPRLATAPKPPPTLQWSDIRGATDNRPVQFTGSADDYLNYEPVVKSMSLAAGAIDGCGTV